MPIEQIEGRTGVLRTMNDGHISLVYLQNWRYFW
jgi:hypothetical protein